MHNNPALNIQHEVNRLLGPNAYMPPARAAVCYAVALNEINKGRYALGLDLLDAIPAGKPHNCSNGPLSFAFREAIPMARVNSETIRRMRPDQIQPLVDAWETYTYSPCGEDVVGLPYSLRYFLHLFDHGQWPELVIDPRTKLSRDTVVG